MNKILKSFLIIGLGLGIFTACDDDRDSNPTLISPTEFVLNTPAISGTVIDLANSSSIEISCSQPDYGFPANVGYYVQVAFDESMTDFTEIGNVNAGTKISIDAPLLASTLTDMKVNKGATDVDFPMDIAVYIRLRAVMMTSDNKAIEGTEILSNVQKERRKQKRSGILNATYTAEREKKNGMIRTIQTDEITKNIKEMCIQANHYLSADMDAAMKHAADTEQSELGKKILHQLQDNLKIADEEMIPICQDTGMAVIFLEVGQDVHFEGAAIEDAVNEGVRQGYTEGFLRKSVVGDPLIRENTKDNTPAVIHYSIVPGDQVKITMAPKGFGSENMSRVFMLKPADGIEGVRHAILTAVKDAGPNACPPMVVGVGIGGTFEKCALLAKQALTRPVDEHSDIPYVKDLEEEMLSKINQLGIGPGGLGGTTTALAVNINTYPTHIAGLPVAVNICCHVNRHVVRTL